MDSVGLEAQQPGDTADDNGNQSKVIAAEELDKTSSGVGNQGDGQGIQPRNT